MSKDQVYYVKTSEKDDIDVVIVETEDGYQMKYAKSECWDPSLRGKDLLRVVDDGTGLVFHWAESKLKNTYNYSQAGYMSIMLDFVNRKSHLPTQYTYLTIDPELGPTLY